MFERIDLGRERERGKVTEAERVCDKFKSIYYH